MLSGLKWGLWCLFLLGPSLAVASPCTLAPRPVLTPLNQCMGTNRTSIAAVGDVLLHGRLQREGYAHPQGFNALWGAIDPVFKAATISYANLEGPVAAGRTRRFRASPDPGARFDNRVYTSFPMFNYHATVLDSLKTSGIDIVSTANNHAMDRGSIGRNQTDAALRARGILYTGSIDASAARDFVAYTPSKMGRIAWIACSFSTNGVPDPKRQVLLCYADRDELLATVHRLAKRSDIAAVFVTPHWGNEYTAKPNQRQKSLARALAGAGATAILGTHPHVLQPWEVLPNAGGGQSLAIYSTGNFVSGQRQTARRSSILAWIELCTPHPTGDLARDIGAKLVVDHASWLPLWMDYTAQGLRLTMNHSGRTGQAAVALNATRRLLPEPAFWDFNGWQGDACTAQVSVIAGGLLQ